MLTLACAAVRALMNALTLDWKGSASSEGLLLPGKRETHADPLGSRTRMSTVAVATTPASAPATLAVTANSPDAGNRVVKLAPEPVGGDPPPLQEIVLPAGAPDAVSV